MADGSHASGSHTNGSRASARYPGGAHAVGARTGGSPAGGAQIAGAQVGGVQVGGAQVGHSPAGASRTLIADPTASVTASGLVAGLKSFAAAHGGASAAIEYVGRRGARIVIVGQDGTWGDHFAESTETARAACARAGVSIQNEWERELIELMRPSNDLWRSMGRRFFSR